MITETFLRTHDRWVKYLTGLTASQFWEMFSRIEANFEAYERQRHERPVASERLELGVRMPCRFCFGLSL
jgi:hypothetical protein